MLRSIPRFFIWLFWLLIAILLVLLVGWIIHHFGGASLNFHVGYFRFLLGVK
jgi:hypothetical protein